MALIIAIIVIVLLFGGGGYYGMGQGYYSGAGFGGIGIVGLLLIIAVVWFLSGRRV